MKTISLSDGRTLRYELTRKRVKNINFRAKEGGFVAVSASPRVSVRFIENYLAAHADLFLKSMENLRKREAQSEINLSSIRFLGKDLTVKIIANSREIALLDEEEARVFTKSRDREYILSLLENAVAERFKALCGELCREAREKMTETFGRAPNAKIQIKTMKSRWGSCTPAAGRISINSRLSAFPRSAVLSVFFHEFAHFAHPDHSKAFYDHLLKVCPSYYEDQKPLKVEKYDEK